MKYSEKRLRRALALVRITVGLVYVCYGYEKLFDPVFFDYGFMQRLSYWQTSVAPGYAWVWQMLAAHPSRWAVFFGTVEMFLGVALLFGLATRLACLVGMLYMLHFSGLSWYPDDTPFFFWRFLELHLGQIALFAVFLLMGLGHAGDIWGLGAIYHRVRVRLRPARKTFPRNDYFDSDFEPEASEVPLERTEPVTGSDEFSSEPSARDHHYQQDDQNDRERSARVVAPITAIRPGGKSPDQHQQHNNQ